MKNYRNEDRTKNKYGIPYQPPAGTQYGQTLRIRKYDSWSAREKKVFSPRLQNDIKNIPLPNTAPAPDFWDGQGLFIHGDTGVGKTVLTANIILDVRRHLWLNFQTKECLFTSVPDLLNQLKQSFNAGEDEDTEWDIMDRQKNTWLLALDDLGVNGKPSEWLIEKLYLLINHRYENLLPTIITSNFDLDKLSELFGDDRITSRIDRMCKIARKSAWDKG